MLLEYYLDNEYIGTETVESLPAGNSQAVQHQWKPVDVEPGQHTVKIVIDPENQMVEFDEGDNVLTRSIYYEGEPKPDILYGVTVILLFVVIVILILMALTTKTRRYKR